MAILESVKCLPGHEHSLAGYIVKSDGIRIEEYYCPRCDKIVKITRTNEDAHK